MTAYGTAQHRQAGAPRGGRRSYAVRCVRCGTGATLPAYRCAACGAPLEVDPAPVGAEDLRVVVGAAGIWRRAGMLPRTGHAVTLGEGETPLLPLDVADGGGRVLTVHAKLESLNPTLSFKDRAMALAASTALDLGLPGLMLASTGNAAVSAAAFAAAAGLPCRVFCGTGSRANLKLAAAAAHGAQVELVEGDYSAAYAAAAAQEDDGWLNVTTTYRNPLLAEAYRAVAVELTESLGRTPDVVVVPVGAGPLLRGLRGGFRDLRAAGAGTAADRPVPRLVGVQAAACAPLARAWPRPDWLAALREPVPVEPTLAGAIADSLRGYEDEGLLTLEAVRDSGGTVVAVDEEDLRASTAELAALGLLVEPAAAAATAAARLPEVRGMVPDGGTCVVVLTGHGAKEVLSSVGNESRRSPA